MPRLPRIAAASANRLPAHITGKFLAFSAATALCVCLFAPARAVAQKAPPVSTAERARKDSVAAAEREELRRLARTTRETSRAQQKSDTATRRAAARAAEPTAFADSGAKALLAMARIAREQQDSALRSYRAIATQRMSIGLGVRKVGLEKLLWRGDNVAKIEWKRGTGVWVTPIGSRMVIPMADQAKSEGFTSAISIPYFPGKETLWLPDGGMAKTDINERDIIHPIARGAEVYYRYATGDSLSIKLPDGKVILIRELRITARKPDWHLFVGSFWFDVSTGQLVRAAYRLSVDMDIWSVATEESKADKIDNVRIAQIRDSIGRLTLSRDAYVKDSTNRAQSRRNGNDDDIPLLVKGAFRPAKAKLDGVSVEYGLYEGRFWLPKENSATASAQIGFMRAPITIDEKFEYDLVDGDLSLPAMPITLAQSMRRDSSVRAGKPDSLVRDARIINDNNNGTDVNVCVGGCDGMPRAKRDSVAKVQLARATRNRDSSLVKAKSAADSTRIFASYNSRRDVQCSRDSIWVRTETRYDGALRMAYNMPCDPEKLEKSKELAPAFAPDEKLFDTRMRDELLSTLDMSLQPAFMPQRPTIRTGLDLVRYNRVEGFSLGVQGTEVLGAGYTLLATGRIGTADLHANGELTLERSNGKRTAFASVFHRLNAVNPEWGGALTFGPSLPAFLYTRDEGFYYRSFGAEIGERYEQRRGSLQYRLFVEHQYTAGDTGVVNTFSLGSAIGDRKFRPNIQSVVASFTGVDVTWQRAYGSNPVGFQFTTTVRGEAATGTRQYARGAVDGTLTRPFGRLIASVTGSTGYSAGDVPAQRLWYIGGLRTVRGQIAGTQEGDAYWLTRYEVGRRSGFFRPVAFFDLGWAGVRDKYTSANTQRGAGLGASFLDGLFRIDFARGLYPLKHWRTDLYLEAPI